MEWLHTSLTARVENIKTGIHINIIETRKLCDKCIPNNSL